MDRFISLVPTWGIVLPLISSILSLFLIVYFLLKGKRSSLLHSFVIVQGLLFIWCTFQVLERLTDSREAKWLTVQIQFSAICYIGAGGLIFFLIYTGSKAVHDKRIILPLCILPGLLYLSVLTNEYHHLFFKVYECSKLIYGPFFYLIVLQNYICYAVSMVTLIRYAVKQRAYERMQALLLVVAFTIPLLSNCAGIFYSSFIADLPPAMDLTPTSFTLTMLVIARAAFKYRFLDIVPEALRGIVDNMKESILVVDRFNRVVDFNPSFQDAFQPYWETRRNEDVGNFAGSLKQRADRSVETVRAIDAIKDGRAVNVSGELSLKGPAWRSYSVNIQPLFSRKKHVYGRIISFNDISEYKGLLNELNEKNAELQAMNEEILAMNEQLKEYAATVEELAISRERNRFTMDMHDTLGHTMTLLIKMLEASIITCRKNPGETEGRLAEAIKVAREGFGELKRSISGLVPEKLEEASSIAGALRRLVEGFRPSGMVIDLSMEGMDGCRNTEYADVLYRLCQEALTNSLRHGRAKHVDIILKYTESRIKLFIVDDGCGCKDIQKGLGLSGMEKRVKSLNGSIVYSSDGEQGFYIRMEIPAKGESEND